MKDERPFLLHIRDALTSIQEYTKDGKKAFMADKKTQDAVIRNVEIVGEATKQLSDGFRAAHPQCPWKQMAGMRDKLIHDYFGVNLEIVWGTVEKRVPELQDKIRSILEDLITEGDPHQAGP